MSKIADKIEALLEKYPNEYFCEESMHLLITYLQREGLTPEAAFQLFGTLSARAQRKLIELLEELISHNPFVIEEGTELLSTIGGNYPHGHISIKPIEACWVQALAKFRDNMRSPA